MRAFTDDLETRLENALSRFDDPVVLHRGAGKEPDYRLSGSLTPSGNGTMSLAFRIWHPASGEIVWTRTFDALHLDQTEAAFEPTVSALTAAIAQTYGVVFTDMRKRLGGNSDGFGCIILAYNYFKAPSAAAHAAARACLEKSVAQHSDFAPGFAALAYLMVDTYLNGLDARPNEKPLDMAIQMAHRAVDLTPQKARAHAAIFLTRFFDKRFEDAFESADQALRLNPYATDTPARIGAAYVLRGDFDKGVALIQRAVRFSSSSPGWYEFYLFLDAHMRGDEKGAIRHALRRSATRFSAGDRSPHHRCARAGRQQSRRRMEPISRAHLSGFRRRSPRRARPLCHGARHPVPPPRRPFQRGCRADQHLESAGWELTRWSIGPESGNRFRDNPMLNQFIRAALIPSDQPSL